MNFKIMTKLQIHENQHKEENTFPKQKYYWEYFCMDRLLEENPLKIYFNCTVCHSTILDNFDIDLNTVTISNKEELEKDIHLVKTYGVEKTFRVHPRGKIISMGVNNGKCGME